MPTLTITVWNVQDYGTRLEKRRGDYAAVNNFIAQVLHEQQTDLFYLVGMHETGTAKLSDLNAALEARTPGERWYFDSVKGAIADAEPDGPNTAITTADQLGWTNSAGYEGYALFFHHDPDKFTMTLAPPVGSDTGKENTQSNGVEPGLLAAGVPEHALSLVLEGRPIIPEPKTARGQWDHPAEPFSVAAPPKWANLDFPTPRSTNLVRNASRRPAVCVIQLKAGGGAADTLMSLMVYHAPGGGRSDDIPPSGTQAGSFARQLYQARNPAANWNWINNTRALACGDFNVDGNPPALPFQRNLSYTAYLSTFASSGAGMTRSAVPLSESVPAHNTALSLTRGNQGPPRPDGPPASFTTAELDNLFTRGIPAGSVQDPPQGALYDLITAVQPGGSLTGAPVTSFLGVVNPAIANAVMRNGHPVNPITHRQIYPQIVDWATFYRGLHAGRFPDNRSAAEFITLFVSDHLPVTFRFTY